MGFKNSKCVIITLKMNSKHYSYLVEEFTIVVLKLFARPVTRSNQALDFK